MPLVKTNFKEVPISSMKYLKHVRKYPCCVCGSKEGISAHHEQPEGHGTMGGKTGDDKTVPLCFLHHRQRHDKGRSVWAGWGVDPDLVINKLQREFKK